MIENDEFIVSSCDTLPNKKYETIGIVVGKVYLKYFLKMMFIMQLEKCVKKHVIKMQMVWLVLK